MLALRMSVYRGKADIGVRSSPRLSAGRDRLVHRWLIWGPVGPTDSATLGSEGTLVEEAQLASWRPSSVAGDGTPGWNDASKAR